MTLQKNSPRSSVRPEVFGTVNVFVNESPYAENVRVYSSGYRLNVIEADHDDPDATDVPPSVMEYETLDDVIDPGEFITTV